MESIKILITTYVVTTTGHVSSNTVVVEVQSFGEANKVIDNLYKVDDNSTRVKYAAVVLN